MEFTDRLFLARYSLDAVAAATPAGIIVLLIMTLFQGTAAYISVFVAQYLGQQKPQHIGKIFWQGFYVIIPGILLLLILAGYAQNLFAFIGHAPELQHLEGIYFRILCLGSALPLLGAVLSGFFIGLGQTKIVMTANILGMIVNIPLDYALINGISIFPEQGIAGAGLSTCCAWGVSTATLTLGLLLSTHSTYGIFHDCRFRLSLWLRLLRYGLPSAMEFFLDILAFSAFILLVGRLGAQELAATNIVLNINSLSFMPMLGFSMGTSSLVGQRMGAGKAHQVPRIVRASMVLTLLYLSILGTLFLLFPDALMQLFKPQDMPIEAFAQVAQIGKNLLFFVLFYLLFDGISVVLYAALKGAGDTFFVMCSRMAVVTGGVLLPLVLGTWFNAGLYYFWTIICAFLVCLAFIAWWRYTRGTWRSMLVIETS